MATDTLGCTSSASHTFGVHFIPPPNFYIPTQNICPDSFGSAYIEGPADSMTQWAAVNWTVANGTITFSDNYGVYFRTDGALAVAVCADGSSTWDLTPDHRPLDELLALAQVLSCRRIEA